jgi:hypothetical protein
MLEKNLASTLSSSGEGEQESSQENHEQSRTRLYSKGPPTVSNDVGSPADARKQTPVVESANRATWSLNESDDVQSIGALDQNIILPTEKLLNKLMKLVDVLPGRPRKLSNVSDHPMSSLTIAHKDPRNFRIAISNLRLSLKDMKLGVKKSCKKITWHYA